MHGSTSGLTASPLPILLATKSFTDVLQSYHSHAYSRPESEALIELLKEVMPKNEALIQERPLRLVDVGTGSGNLGITAKLLCPELDVTLIDASRHALTIAETNAESLHADVEALQSDLLSDYPFVADYIIANLPYVDPEWERSPETDHEPDSALFAANHGLALIFELIAQTKKSSRLAENSFSKPTPNSTLQLKRGRSVRPCSP